MTKDEALTLEALKYAASMGYGGMVKEMFAPFTIKGDEALAQPAQEPVAFYRCKGCGHAYEQAPPTSCDCMDDGGFDRVEYFTTPAKRPWVGLTYAQFLEAARLAETGNYLVAFQRIQQWLQEKNT